jgi:SOS response regulatory protein OraA/RecX
MILLTLSQKYPYFTDEISNFLESRDDSDGMKTEIHRYLSKYDISDFKEKSKFFAALQRKGFHYKKIKDALEELQEI